MPSIQNLTSRIAGFGSAGVDRNLVLLTLLVFSIGIVPLMSRWEWLQGASFALVLLSCMRAVSVTPRAARIAWALGIIPFVLVLVPVGSDHPVMYVGRILLLAFFVYTVAVLLRQLMTARQVEPGTLLAAASTYLLLGVVWSIVFGFIEAFDPGSFSFPDHDAGGYSSLLYFSFVTLVSLGYGEITPVTEAARSMAILEAIAGALFLTMLVARLVGLYTARQSNDNE